MQIDVNTLIIGILIGAVIALVIKMEVKSINVKMEKLGIALGVEGFDKKELPSGVTIGDVNGSTMGDIAGRDINKNSYMYKTMQAAAREAVKFALADFIGGNNFDHVRLQRVIRWTSKTQDVKLKSRLRSISSRGNPDFPSAYYSEYLASSNLIHEIEQQKRELAEQGWRLTVVRPIDSTDDGYIVELIAEKML